MYSYFTRGFRWIKDKLLFFDFSDLLNYLKKSEGEYRGALELSLQAGIHLSSVSIRKQQRSSCESNLFFDKTKRNESL
ncbi:hypothetical protein [Holospora elegans]|uniref:hypothetical protein n=1 Tax=Holospora elegans TaxID=431043 RepID=UPI0013923C6E|nr:hypothetical protein [Holospora elegans]